MRDHSPACAQCSRNGDEARQPDREDHTEWPGGSRAGCAESNRELDVAPANPVTHREVERRPQQAPAPRRMVCAGGESR